MANKATAKIDITSFSVAAARATVSYETVETIQPIAVAARLLVPNGFEALAVVTLNLRFAKEATSQQVDESLNYFLLNLRSLVRKTDRVFLCQRMVYFLLENADAQGSIIVQDRLWERLLWLVHHLHETSVCAPLLVALGQSAYPQPASRIDDFLEDACHAGRIFDCQTMQAINYLEEPETPYVPAPAPRMLRETNPGMSVTAPQPAIPFMPSLPQKLPHRIRKLIKPQLARELQCCPVGKERDTLTVAMLDPQDQSALQRLERETGLRIFPVLTQPDQLEIAIDQLG